MFVIECLVKEIHLSQAFFDLLRANVPFLKDFAKFIGKQLCQSLSFDKVTGLRPATLSKKRL